MLSPLTGTTETRRDLHALPDEAEPRVRDARLDALRGIAMTMVVVQHLGWLHLKYQVAPGLWPTFPGTWADISKVGTFWLQVMVWTGPFCVQLFAFVSGYLLRGSKRRSFESFVGSRVVTLIVPLLAWMLFYWLDPQTSAFFVNKGTLGQYFLAAAKNPNGGFIGPLWFLPALFISSVAVLATLRVTTRSWALVVLAGLSLLLARYLGILGGGSYYGLLEASRFLPYVAAGALLRGWTTLRWRRGWKRLPFTAASVGLYVWLTQTMPKLTATLPLLPKPFNTPAAIAQQTLLGPVWALAGIWLCIELVALLPDKALGVPAWLGVNSLGICGAHLPAYALMVSLGIGSPWIGYPAVLAASAALSWLLGLNGVTGAVFLGRGSLAKALRLPARRGPRGVEAPRARRERDGDTSMPVTDPAAAHGAMADAAEGGREVV